MTRAPWLVVLLVKLCHAIGCPPGQYIASVDSCQNCSAGFYSSVDNLMSCIQCEKGAYAPEIGSSACLYCPTATLPAQRTCNRGLCSTAMGLPCSSCSGVCKACNLGSYGTGLTKCQGCPAGTFSRTAGISSSRSCQPCDMGEATFPRDTGKSACSSCAAVNRLLPRNAFFNGYGQFCPWQCNEGYEFVRATGGNATLNATYTAQGFAGLSNESLMFLYHRDNDYCCSTVNVLVGQYLLGCSPTSDGSAVACTPIPNAAFIENGTKLNRCGDWECNFGHYRIGNKCIQQPACPKGQTWSRDTSGTLIASSTNGSFSCSPCGVCIGGSETAVPCNATNETVCRTCRSSWFSAPGSPCLQQVPLGYVPVKNQPGQMPPYQGRPTLIGETLTPITDWRFQPLFTYVQCAPIEGNQRHVQTTAQDMCTSNCIGGTLSCPTECKPWNGTVGWYQQLDRCVPCVFDAYGCDEGLYLNMKVCGPLSNAVCADCAYPVSRLPNANPWTSPRVLDNGSPYPCNFTCFDGFSKYNNSCVACTLIPPNAEIIPGTGCSWRCMQGYIPLGTTGCQGCGAPPVCAVGFYADYFNNSQCMVCRPCDAPIPNANYTSRGLPRSPETCQQACLKGFWYNYMVGVGVPDVCNTCSPTLDCIAGFNYFTPCTTTRDAICQTCSSCPIGMGTATPCSPLANITCSKCDPLLLPSNASWSSECSWFCSAGFMQEGQACRRCMGYTALHRSDPTVLCKPSELLVVPDNGCGRCDSCPALAPGMQFTGDGQCGTMYSTTCASRAYPLHGRPNVTTDPNGTCPWVCNTGYTRQVADESAGMADYLSNYQLMSLPAVNDVLIRAFFHRDTDACCNTSIVTAGKYLYGCSQTSDGGAAPCDLLLTATYIHDGIPNKFDRCSDYTCRTGYFNAGDTCKAQPMCGYKQTVRRDADGAIATNPVDGSYACVACSQCLLGTQSMHPCSQGNDTVCKLCPPAAPFSFGGGACIESIPAGHSAVDITYQTPPAFQGRPSFQSDGVTGVSWPLTLHTYTACALIPPERHYMPSETACAKDSEDIFSCVSPDCSTECKPWDGTMGWFQQYDGSCGPCVFSADLCENYEYLDMTTCGPGTANIPTCVQCSLEQLPENAYQWKNPRSLDFKGKYKCDYECQAGFLKYNYTCLNCPPIPDHTVITSGCDWECAQGYVRNKTSCVPCPPPAPCPLGSYVDYTNSTSQCPTCQACDGTGLYPNTAFNSRSNCSYTCKINHYSPSGIDPSTSFPMGPCVQCTTRICDQGEYPTQCTVSENSQCLPCDTCPVGQKQTAACTPQSKTVCQPCDPSLKPKNADWAPFCGWDCPQETVFVSKTYECYKPPPTTPPPPTTTPRPTTTTKAPTTTAAPPPVFASVVKISLPSAIDTTLSDMARIVATQSRCIQCKAQVLSLTGPDGQVIVCTNNVCPGVPDNIMKIMMGTNKRRRRLLQELDWTVSIGMISTVPLPATPVIVIGNSTFNSTAIINAKVSASDAGTIFDNSTAFINAVSNYVAPPTTTRAVRQLRVTAAPRVEVAADTSSSSDSTAIGVIIGAAIGGVTAVLIGGGIVYLYLKKRKLGLEKKKEDDVIPTTTLVPATSAPAQSEYSMFTPGLINIRISNFSDI